MSEKNGDRPCRERGLSEVIGFVLILGIIVAAFSLYLTYGIPSQGRENEIAHMNDIRDEFVNYKTGVDNLWINHLTDTALGETFKLGTPGQTSQGSNSIIPVIQPVGSSGTVAINLRTSVPETLAITSQSLVINSTNQISVDFPPAQTLSYAPNHMYVNISGILAADLNQNGVFGTTVTGTGWTAILNLTPQVSFYQNYSMPSTTTPCTAQQLANGAINVRGSGSDMGCFIPSTQSNYTGTDLQISIMKNNIVSMQNYPVYKTVKPGTTYVVDLLDNSYGLRSIIQQGTTVNLNTDKSLGSINALGNMSFGFSRTTYSLAPLPLGSLEYRGYNNYWIPQTYYYQMGGVFLAQSDGITYKLPPSITFASGPNGNISVNIIAIAYDPASSGAIGGSTPVQISTSMKPDSGYLPYAPVTPNTWSANITIASSDPNAVSMWRNYLDTAANQTGGIPREYYNVTSTASGSSISLMGIPDPLGNPHISLQVKTANLTAKVQSAGGP